MATHPEQTTGDGPDLFSVGRVASEIGLSPGTLRIWERRYGRPSPIRLPSGHRRYTAEEVQWLRKVAEALALGHRPGKVMRATDEDLAKLLRRDRAPADEDEDVTPWLECVAIYDEAGLREAFRSSREELDGTVPFLDRVARFLRALGSAWAEGSLSVRHEHFATGVMAEELGLLRRELAVERGTEGGPMVLAALSGEEHGLGLLLVDVVCADHGVRTCVLGPDTPVDEVLDAARETGARAVGISVPLSNRTPAGVERIQDLRGQLPEGVDLVVGGEGIHRARRLGGAIRFEHLARFAQWLGERDWARQDG